MRLRIVEGSIRSIEYLPKVFPRVIKEEQLSQLKDEWLMYQVEPDNEIGNGDGRVDHYWRAVLAIKSYSGELKYTLLGTLVKSVLSLHHGNAAVERSLSDNKNTYSPERVNLLPETLIGLRRMKKYVRSKGSAHNIVVSEKMLQSMWSAKQSDDERLANEILANERKAKELAEKKRKEDEEREMEKGANA